MKPKILAILCAIFTGLFVLPHAYAKEGNFYGIGATGFATNDIDGQSLDDVSYKLGIGYELGKQWNIELGFQALGEDRLAKNELSFDNASQEITAVYLSALGRAANRHGELFYRIGLVRADVSADFLSTGPDCESGSTGMAGLNGGLVCQLSDSNIAGVIGFGFDFYIHHSTMLRIEIEHIQGQDGFSAQAAYIGFRLNF